MKESCYAILALMLSACASHTGVVSTGNNAYMIAKQQATGFPGLGNMKAEIVAEGEAYCSGKNMQFRLIRVEETQPPYILGNYPRSEINFRCVSPASSNITESGEQPRTEVAPKREPSMATGTAFVISNPQNLVTAFHVIDGAKSIEISCPHSFEGTAVIDRIDPANDLALLRVESILPSYLELAPDNSTRVGQNVFTFGFPVPGLLGTEPKYSNGAISSLSGVAGAANLLQVTVPIQPGNSGGPLLDEFGRVVGVVTSTAAVQGFIRQTGTIPQNINWAVRSEYLRPLLSTVSSNKPQRGVSAVDHSQKSVCLVKAIGK